MGIKLSNELHPLFHTLAELFLHPHVDCVSDGFREYLFAMDGAQDGPHYLCVGVRIMSEFKDKLHGSQGMVFRDLCY